MPDPSVSPADTIRLAEDGLAELRAAVADDTMPCLFTDDARGLLKAWDVLLAVGERDKAEIERLTEERGAAMREAVIWQRDRNVQASAGERDRRQIARLADRLTDAQQILARLEFLRYGSRTRLDERPDEVFECPVCGWPQGGHRGPGRYKGNVENTHEEGCSLYAVLHGEPAPRLLECNDRPARAVLADEEDAGDA